MRSEPVSCHSGCTLGSPLKFALAATECMASRVRSKVERGCPHNPAPCAVVTWATSAAPFHEQDILNSAARQAVGHAAADGTAANDDEFRVGNLGFMFLLFATG